MKCQQVYFKLKLVTDNLPLFSHFNCTFLPRTYHRPPTHLGGSSADYAVAQGASKTTLEMFDKYQMASPGMNYGMVQSASTSSEFVSRCLVKQKKKFASKSWEVINKVGRSTENYFYVTSLFLCFQVFSPNTN